MPWWIIFVFIAAGAVGYAVPGLEERWRDRHAPAADPDSWLERVTFTRLIVHTSDDRSIEGLMVDVADDGVLLRAARLLGATTVDLAGDVWIPRPRVLFVQTAPVEAAQP